MMYLGQTHSLNVWIWICWGCSQDSTVDSVTAVISYWWTDRDTTFCCVQ